MDFDENVLDATNNENLKSDDCETNASILECQNEENTETHFQTISTIVKINIYITKFLLNSDKMAI